MLTAHCTLPRICQPLPRIAPLPMCLLLPQGAGQGVPPLHCLLEARHHKLRGPRLRPACSQVHQLPSPGTHEQCTESGALRSKGRDRGRAPSWLARRAGAGTKRAAPRQQGRYRQSSAPQHTVQHWRGGSGSSGSSSSGAASCAGQHTHHAERCRVAWRALMTHLPRPVPSASAPCLQVLAKSSKMIPVMLMGSVLHGKRYSMLEYACCLAISGGGGTGRGAALQGAHGRACWMCAAATRALAPGSAAQCGLCSAAAPKAARNKQAGSQPASQPSFACWCSSLPRPALQPAWACLACAAAAQ